MKSLFKKIILILAIAAVGYAFTISPNGVYLIPTATLIKEKAEAAQKEQRIIHSLDLEKIRSAQPQPNNG